MQNLYRFALLATLKMDPNKSLRDGRKHGFKKEDEDARFFALVELSHLGVKIKLVICSRERSGAMRLKKTTEKSSD